MFPMDGFRWILQNIEDLIFRKWQDITCKMIFLIFIKFFLKVTFHLKLLKHYCFPCCIVHLLWPILLLIICIIPPTPHFCVTHLPTQDSLLISLILFIQRTSKHYVWYLHISGFTQLPDEHSTRIDFSTLYRALHCGCKRKNPSSLQECGTCQQQY